MVIGYQLSVFGFQFSVIGFQFSETTDSDK